MEALERAELTAADLDALAGVCFLLFLVLWSYKFAWLLIMCMGRGGTSLF